MKLKYLPAIFVAVFSASAYAANGMSDGNPPSMNGATNDMDSASPEKGLPFDSTQERGRRSYEQRSSPSHSGYDSGPMYRRDNSGYDSGPTYRGRSGTGTGIEGPGSGSQNKD